MLKRLKEGMSITEFAREVGISISYAHKVIKKLESLNIVELLREGKKKVIKFKSRKIKHFLDIFGQKILDLLFLRGYVNFLRRVRGKSPEFASRVLGKSYQEIRRKLSMLEEFGLVKINEFIELHPDLDEVIEELIMLEFKDKGLYKTAFSAFPDYGIEIIDERKIFVDKKPDINEIFIHSLKLMRDKRDGMLVMLFYLKNREKFDIERLLDLATEYGVKDRLQELFLAINLSRARFFPDLNEIKDKIRDYGIDIFVSSKKKIEEFLVTLGKVRLYPIGGTYLVLKGLKSSTKDVDFLVSHEDWRRIRKVFEKKNILLERMGKGIYRLRNDILVDFFVGSVFGFPLEKMKVKERKRIGEVILGFLDPSVIFLLKIRAGREVDLDDCRTLMENEDIDFDWVIKNLEERDFFALLDFFELYGIRGKIYRKVERRILEILVKELLKKGKKISEIARELGVSYSRVKNIVERISKVPSRR